MTQQVFLFSEEQYTQTLLKEFKLKLHRHYSIEILRSYHVIITWVKPAWWQWARKHGISEAEFYLSRYKAIGDRITFKYK